jgi:hypothetical protein
MSPKEKAQELFDKYYQIFEDDEDEHYIGTCKRISKLSALIAVDEIIEANPCYESSDRGLNFSWQDNTYYWQQVKQFIEEI